MPMSKGSFAKKSSGVLLQRVGGDKSQSRRNAKDNVSIAKRIIHRISEIPTEKSGDSGTVILESESPTKNCIETFMALQLRRKTHESIIYIDKDSAPRIMPFGEN